MMVKEYLSLKGFQFTERNVSQDEEARAQLIALGFDATPVTVIGDRVVEGFNVVAIDEALSSLQGQGLS